MAQTKAWPILSSRNRVTISLQIAKIMPCARRILITTQQDTHVPSTCAISTGKTDDTEAETHTWENIQTAEESTVTQAISKKIATHAIVGATLQNEHGKGKEKGEERIGGIPAEKGKQQSLVLLLKPSGNTSIQTRRANFSGSYTQNFTNNPNRHKNITHKHMSANTDKEPLTCQNMQSEKSLTLTHVPPKHTEARTTNDTTMTERT